MILDVLREEIHRSRDRVLGIMDFRYAPMALGDAVTWLTKLQVLAHTHGIKKVEVLIYAPPGGFSRYVTPYNYVGTLEGILPAFLCAPMMSALRFYTSPVPYVASQRIVGALLAQAHTWPSIVSHFRRNLDYHSHLKINAFFERNGWIPKLAPPKGFQAETEAFSMSHLAGRRPFILNIRQSALTNIPDSLKRDSPVEIWHEFLCQAQRLWPEVLFVLVGEFSTWERKIALLPNIIVPRTFGYGLGHELTLLLNGTPFIGSSSGFAAVATFSDVPYCITRYQYGATGYMKGIGIPYGSDHFPFASKNQWLSWIPETVDSLLDLFQRVWSVRYPVRRLTDVSDQ